MAEIGINIDRAARLLKAGRLVGIPTETVYGLAGNALDEEAVLRIFSTKDRPKFDPLIVHSWAAERFQAFTENWPAGAQTLAEAFWPGPLTLLLPKKPLLPDLVTAGNDRVACRIPNHPITLELLQAVDFPLAAPSANPFGYVSPTLPQHVAAQLGEKVPYILDGGSCEIGLESTIVGFEGEQPIIYRLGGLPAEAIAEATGQQPLLQTSGNQHPAAPGMLRSHYAPHKGLLLVQEQLLPQAPKGHKVALLAYNACRQDFPREDQYLLAPGGLVEEAARNLFKMLRLLDEMDYPEIWCELVPDEGLGRAVNERLRKAAGE